MSYVQLTLYERFATYQFNLAGFGVRDIARRLKRHHSTISRELRRNAAREPNARYDISLAHEQAMQRRQCARHHRRASNVALRLYVVQRLQAHWSAEAIAGRVQLDFPRDRSMRVSHETIYQWIYVDAKGGGTLHRCLPSQHTRRRKQRRYGSLRWLIPGRRSIKQRPAVVDQRRRFGDWEGDTVYGRNTQHCLLTSVERKSRYLIAGRISDRRATTVANCHIEQFSALPLSWRKTLTLDNGKEFSGFSQLERQTRISVFFADPYCAWQRGSNENSNGLLRRYFPKGTDFSTVSDEKLASVVDILNNRPRKCLNYRTPTEVVQRAFSGAVRS
jgi:transposase, IS30 family